MQWLNTHDGRIGVRVGEWSGSVVGEESGEREVGEGRWVNKVGDRNSFA